MTTFEYCLGIILTKYNSKSLNIHVKHSYLYAHSKLYPDLPVFTNPLPVLLLCPVCCYEILRSNSSMHLIKNCALPTLRLKGTNINYTNAVTDLP